MFECDLEPVFYQWSEPVARKEHKCCECSAPILKGEKHFVATGKWDGDITTYRQHLMCLEACMYVRDRLNGGECIPFGSLMNWHDEIRVYRPDRKHPDWKAIRSLLAKIKWRERGQRQD